MEVKNEKVTSSGTVLNGDRKYKYPAHPPGTVLRTERRRKRYSGPSYRYRGIVTPARLLAMMPRQSIIDALRPFMGSSQNIKMPDDPDSSKTAPRLRRRPGAIYPLKIRVPLRREPEEFRNEYIDYDAEIPIRTALRLEYLMGSTRVRLNDKSYMELLQWAIDDEEKQEIERNKKAREEREQERVKKLVVEGEMTPPADIKHLYKHPVFKVNRMFRRIAKHDSELTAAPVQTHKIIPLEPYEFDGDMFFKHLHTFGTPDYLPPKVAAARRIERRIKIRKARLRARAEKRRQEEEQKEIKNLYDQYKRRPPVEDQELKEFDEFFDHRGSIVESMDSKTEQDHDKNPRGSIDSSVVVREVRDVHRDEVIAQRELEVERRRLRKEKEAEEDERSIRQLKKRLERDRKALFEQQQRDFQAFQAGQIIPELHEPDKEPTPPSLEEPASLQDIRKRFGVRGLANLDKYVPPVNRVMRKYVDDAVGAEELFNTTLEVKRLYQRKQLRCDDFLKKIGRPY